MVFFRFFCWTTWLKCLKHLRQSDKVRDFAFPTFLGLKLDIKSIAGKDLWAPRNSLRDTHWLMGGHHETATQWSCDCVKPGSLSETVKGFDFSNMQMYKLLCIPSNLQKKEWLVACNAASPNVTCAGEDLRVLLALILERCYVAPGCSINNSVTVSWTPDSKFSLVQPTSWMSPRKRWLGCELVWFCTFAIGLQISCTTNLAVVLFLPHGSSSHRKPCSDVVFQVGEKRGCPVDLTTEVSKVGSMLTVSGKIHPNSCGIFAVGKSSSIRGLPIGATLSEALSTRWLSGWLVVSGCCVEKTVSTCWNNAGCCVFMIFGWGAVRELRALALCVGPASFFHHSNDGWSDEKPCFPVFDSKFGKSGKDTSFKL